MSAAGPPPLAMTLKVGMGGGPAEVVEVAASVVEVVSAAEVVEAERVVEISVETEAVDEETSVETVEEGSVEVETVDEEASVAEADSDETVVDPGLQTAAATISTQQRPKATTKALTRILKKANVKK